MVRKSDRTKSKEKVEIEKAPGRKVGRPPKRKKKESDSDAESETKEVGDISEPNEGDPQNKASSRRSSRHHHHPSEPSESDERESENPEKKNKEWEEDPDFWGQEDSAPAEDTSVAEEATTWKIQSSNGSGGEIQKLKICRQRVPNDSSDPSSPAKDSPRRKKKSKHSDENAESGGEVSSSNEAKDEAKPDSASVMSIILGNNEGGDASKTILDDSRPEIAEEVVLHNIPIPGEGFPQKIHSMPAVLEVKSSSRRGSQEEGGNGENLPPSVEKTESVSRKPSTEDQASEAAIGENASRDKVPVESNDSKESGATPGENLKPESVDDKPPRVRTKSETTEDLKTPRVRTRSETSEDGKGEKKLLLSKVKVNSEEALDEIAKKLNERAARFAKDDTKEKEKRASRVSTDSIEPPKSPREEGELTPEQKKSKHTTIIINKPKEIISKPTRLKRTTDEIPPAERKRRVLLKSKSRDKQNDRPINISADTLMRLVPEVKTITPEQVAAFPLDDEELTRFEMDGDDDQPHDMSPKMSKKKIVMKAKEVEIRVENDTRHITKKKPIVFDKENAHNKPVGPKLPNQENHRVVRRISLVGNEMPVKKPRRSPSPGAKNQTEVLFITNLVRPFTVPQLRELLARTGTIAPNGFYIDKIKSKCYVKYTDVEMAVETRHALNGVRWPVNNPKTLKVEFVPPEQMTVVQQMAEDDTTTKKVESDSIGGWLSEQAALKPQRKVTTAVREWDMGKIGAGPLEEKRPLHDWRGNKQPDQPEVKRRAPSPPIKLDYQPPARKIKKRDNDAPAKLLDDLFRKTKNTPCIYWLPLSANQIAVKEEMRRQHLAENERRLAELRKTDHSRRENRDRDRTKSRDRRKK